MVGGGPAGVATAYFLSQAGFKIMLVEQMPKLGRKPCGGGIPPHINRVFPAPSDVILNTIKSMAINFEYNEIGVWDAGKPIFYMIDRSRYLEHYSTSFDIKLKVGAKIENNVVRVGSDEFELSKTIIATGFAWRMDERDMLAQTIQYYVKLPRIDEPDRIEFYFFKDLIGYAWFFPYGDREAKIGIGGLDKTVEELEAMLRKLIDRLNLQVEILRVDGAPIDMGGIKIEWATDPTYVVGEAIGAVMPLTGEGIRPSVLTAKALAYSIINNKDYKSSLKELSIYKPSRQQVKILKRLRKEGYIPTIRELSPKTVELIYKFGLGEARLRDFLGVLPSSLSLLRSLF